MTNTPTILVCDDEVSYLDLYEAMLSEEGMNVLKTVSGRECISLAESKGPDLILLDVSLPGLSGFDVCSLLKKGPRTRFIPLIFVTAAFKDVKDRVHGIQRGADDYITKPFHHDELMVRIKALLRMRDLQEELIHERETKEELEKTIDHLKTKLEGSGGHRPVIVRDPRMIRIMEMIETIRDTTANVLILGETGTGKGLLAEAVHRLSARRDAPLVKVDCAALPSTLMESGLFGHEKGSFTGAVKTHLGPFERADGGTIFLDEIGEIPLELQAKLLRVIQDMEFERVGGERTISVNVRIIAATNVPLEKAVEEKKFRVDLFYRLNVIRLDLPPLRERPEDLIPLAHHFLKRYAGKNKKSVDVIEEAAVTKLLGHTWPGNVRELENVIERAVVLSSGETLSPEVIHFSAQTPKPVFRDLDRPLKDIVFDVEKEAIFRALSRTDGSVERAAGQLGVNRTTLYSKMKKYGIPMRS